MKVFTFSNVALAVVLSTFLLSITNAHAYVDPGTGSYVFQVAAAFMVGGLYTVKLSWRRIVDKVKKVTSKEIK